MIKTIRYFIFSIAFFLSLSIPSFTNVLSWNYNKQPSLLLTDVVGLIESNGSFMIDSEVMTNSNSSHFIRIEDMIAPYDNDFENVFVSFSKKHLSSHVIVKVYDTFTDQLLSEMRFDENKIISLGKAGVLSDRIHLTVELFGTDVELRSVGIILEPSLIIDDIGFTISHNKLYVNQEILLIQLQLNEEAQVSLFVYNSEGTVVKRIVIEQVLDSGNYHFYWNPILVEENLMGSIYYVWLQVENIRSYPIESVRQVYAIP